MINIYLVWKIFNHFQRSKNYFSLLNMKENFAINPIELTKYFRELQSYLHPDKFSQK